jgi:flagellar biogenesis protein FliO
MEALQQLFAVAAVLAVLCGGLWLLKRKGWAQTAWRRAGEDGRPRLEVVDRLVLTPQHSLHLVCWADRTLLIALSPHSCELLESAPGGVASTNGRDQIRPLRTP